MAGGRHKCGPYRSAMNGGWVLNERIWIASSNGYPHSFFNRIIAPLQSSISGQPYPHKTPVGHF
jgi:hypothetical protein